MSTLGRIAVLNGECNLAQIAIETYWFVLRKTIAVEDQVNTMAAIEDMKAPSDAVFLELLPFDLETRAVRLRTQSGQRLDRRRRLRQHLAERRKARDRFLRYIARRHAAAVCRTSLNRMLAGRMRCRRLRHSPVPDTKTRSLIAAFQYSSAPMSSETTHSRGGDMARDSSRSTNRNQESTIQPSATCSADCLRLRAAHSWARASVGCRCFLSIAPG